MGLLGRFLEVGISTVDIRASVEFYEALGFWQAQTADTWPHPYGVLTDGRIFLGLHQSAFDSPVLTFVRAGVAAFARELESQAQPLIYARTAEHEFNRLAFKDPTGQIVVVVEARTYSPVMRASQRVSACGYFEEFSMPSTDFAAPRQFWESYGFVATEEAPLPYRHLSLTSDHLDIAFHARRLLDRAVLVFRDHGMPERLAKLREAAAGAWLDPPLGLSAAANGLLLAPEGTALLLLDEEG